MQVIWFCKYGIRANTSLIIFAHFLQDTVVTMITQTKSCIASLVLVSVFVHIGDFYPNNEMASK